jgi:hypothetical protein
MRSCDLNAAGLAPYVSIEMELELALRCLSLGFDA